MASFLNPLTMHCFTLMLLFLSFSCESREFLVGGGENLWKVTSSPDGLNKWSGEVRFRIGDTLVLKYDPKTDSVLQVTKEDYTICNTSKPIKSFNDGDTKILLDRSGPFYFISGTEGHCEKGQKLLVTVLSPKHGVIMAHPPAASPTPAPAPSPAGGGGLFPVAPVPTSGCGNGLMGGGGADVGLKFVLGSSLVGLAFLM